MISVYVNLTVLIYFSVAISYSLFLSIYAIGLRNQII